MVKVHFKALIKVYDYVIIKDYISIDSYYYYYYYYILLITSIKPFGTLCQSCI